MRKDLSQLFEEFLYEAEFVRKIRPKTLKAYSHTFDLFLKLIPDISSDTLNKHSVIAFFKILQERRRIVGKGIVKTGIKKSTTATYWSKLNAFFGWLHFNKHLKTNPFSELPYPTPSYDNQKYLTKEKIEKIITAIHTHHDNNILILKRNLVLFYILLFCGLRREELMLLQIRDIDFDRKTLTIRGDTSKSATTRQIPLHSTLIIHLRDYLAVRRKYSTPYLIVSSQKDERLTFDGLDHWIRKLIRCSGVTFHLHQFRHTFAVNFLRSSNNVVKLKQLLGHKSIAMTLTYLRCMPVDELRSDIECMSIDSLI